MADARCVLEILVELGASPLGQDPAPDHRPEHLVALQDGRIIGYPMLKPHDHRHGVAMEILEQHHDLEAVHAMLRHTRIDTTLTYARIRPAELKRAMDFYEDKAVGVLDKFGGPKRTRTRVFQSRPHFRQFDQPVARQHHRNRGTRVKHAS